MKKCSLVGLEGKEDFRFYRYPMQSFPILEGYVLLKVEAPPLTEEEDRDRGLLVLDGTWRYAEKMLQAVEFQQSLIYRSIPSCWKTAYPRRQTNCPDPEKGLASIEAIFAAYQILGRDTAGLLDNYYWKDLFYQTNQPHLKKLD